MTAGNKGVTLWASAVGQTLNGTDSDDELGGFSGATTMNGGAGNDIYYRKAYNVINEAPGGGIDTVVTYENYTLGANLENLKALNADTYGIGNELDNVITGGAGRQQLFGAAGNDTLTGGAGSDIFIFRPGNGSDTITDFEAGAGGDVAQIGRFGLYSFADVQARLVQSGADAVLQLSANETLTFKNHQVADFSADDFQYGIDLTKYQLSFADEFDTLNLRPDGGVWRTSYWDGASGRSLPSNGELEIYMDKGYLSLGVDPFSISDGVLTIHAAPASAAVQAATGHAYTSGMISSRGSFSQLYGYFEIRAELPVDHGTWPAFWLLPADGSWPPELDVMEAIGNKSVVYETSHTNSTGKHTQTSIASWVGDISAGMHTYGVLWTDKELVWYVDGNEVFRTATPSDMHKPMHLVANLAVGGYWPGNPTSDFTGADMKIDYIHAYSLPASVEVVTDHTTVLTDQQQNLTLTGNQAIDGTGNTLANTMTGNSAANTLNGGAGNDILTGGGGNDRLIGGDGLDTARYAGQHANYTITSSGDITTVTGSTTGSDSLQGIERITFDDGTLALDITGNAGQIYRLYQAAFDREPDKAGLSFWVKTFDTGNTSLAAIADQFIHAPEFTALYGAANTVSNSSYVQLLYTHTLGRSFDTAGLNYWVDRLDHDGISRSDALAFFSESSENQGRVADATAHGIWLL